MGIFDKFKENKSIQGNTKSQNSNKNIYDELGIIESFTLLVGSQLNHFISALSRDNVELLNENEKKAFEVLWNVACIDIDGFGNNIWNLKKGSFEVYNKDGVIVSFEKRSSELKDKYGYDEGRANFVYLSKDGNFIINQNERNKKAFLVYVSKNITDRLLNVLRNAEGEALEIKVENVMSKTGLGIPDTISKNSNQLNRNIANDYNNANDDIELNDEEVRKKR